MIGKQLIRSSTSSAVNYRVACRARSKAKFVVKMSIAVEEADETVFWLELLEDSQMVAADRLAPLKQEATAILSVMSKARKNIHRNRE